MIPRTIWLNIYRIIYHLDLFILNVYLGIKNQNLLFALCLFNNLLCYCYVIYYMSSTSTSEPDIFLGLIAVFEWPWMICSCDLLSKQVNFFVMVVCFAKTIGFDLWRSWLIILVTLSTGEDLLAKGSKYLCMCSLVVSKPSSDNDPSTYPPFN